ncbi:Ndufa10p [Mactra antiquata]
MALRQVKVCDLLARCSSPLTRPKNAAALVSVEGRRNLTMNPDYKKPFPYKTKKFNILRAIFDFTVSRLNENSRIVMIEGPPCVGKSEFAKNLAHRFNLLHIPGVTETDLFTVNGFDLRQLNEMMPSPKMKKFDLQDFYSENNPELFYNFGRTQIDFFEMRSRQYVQALRHVLNTGQGVVLENNVWGDANYALNMADFGYFSKNGIKWYMHNRKNTLNFYWKPHLIIYLDAPSSYVVENLKAKHPEYEGSPALTEKFFDGLKDKYQKFYLPYMSKYMEILNYDARKLEEFDLLALDLEGLDLISRYGDLKFEDWRRDMEEDWTFYRLSIGNDAHTRGKTQWRLPLDCPELMMNGEENRAYQNICLMFPQLALPEEYWYDKQGNFIERPELNDPTPLSLASESELAQGVLEAGPKAQAIEGAK